jgi:hypothetical protein
MLVFISGLHMHRQWGAMGEYNCIHMCTHIHKNITYEIAQEHLQIMDTNWAKAIIGWVTESQATLFHRWENVKLGMLTTGLPVPRPGPVVQKRLQPPTKEPSARGKTPETPKRNTLNSGTRRGM